MCKAKWLSRLSQYIHCSHTVIKTNGYFYSGDSLQGKCEEHQFKCVNKRCVNMDKVCDNIDDCGDLSDEIGCRK